MPATTSPGCASLIRGAEGLNMHPKDEFDGIFDKLSTRYFGPLSTTTFPTETSNFDEFVQSRLDLTVMAFAAAPHKTVTHAALSNGRSVCQLVPDGDEERTVEFLARVTRHARAMHAHSFFFSRITDASSLGEGSEFCILWLAHHVGAEQRLRSGIIPIHNGELGEILESPENTMGPAGEACMHVLQ